MEERLVELFRAKVADGPLGLWRSQPADDLLFPIPLVHKQDIGVVPCSDLKGLSSAYGEDIHLDPELAKSGKMKASRPESAVEVVAAKIRRSPLLGLGAIVGPGPVLQAHRLSRANSSATA